MSGWVSFFVGFSAPVAASSLAFSEYLIRTLPEEVLPPQLELTKKIIAVGIILVFTLIHYFGLRSGSRVQNVLTSIKIGLIMAFLERPVESPISIGVILAGIPIFYWLTKNQFKTPEE